MRNESGKSIVTLVILTILIIIGASIILNYAKQMLIETKEQDLRTNMLLMCSPAGMFTLLGEISFTMVIFEISASILFFAAVFILNFA